MVDGQLMSTHVNSCQLITEGAHLVPIASAAGALFSPLTHLDSGCARPAACLGPRMPRMPRMPR